MPDYTHETNSRPSEKSQFVHAAEIDSAEYWKGDQIWAYFVQILHPIAHVELSDANNFLPCQATPLKLSLKRRRSPNSNMYPRYAAQKNIGY